MKYIGKEDHLMMPPLSKLVVTQALYDMLFQYVLTPEKEKNLLDFINRIEVHQKSNQYRSTPFSLPVEELQFLEEGIEELKLLCWQLVPVHIFEIDIPALPSSEDYDKAKDQIEQILTDLFVFNWQGENQILVYSTITI
ncbi:MAG: hypothetical protein GX825_00770 [Syntrophomonadaceae bacterium]|nr:hypothetical protein [Syntrophomonadaceae bacterium]